MESEDQDDDPVAAAAVPAAAADCASDGHRHGKAHDKKTAGDSVHSFIETFSCGCEPPCKAQIIQLATQRQQEPAAFVKALRHEYLDLNEHHRSEWLLDFFNKSIDNDGNVRFHVYEQPLCAQAFTDLYGFSLGKLRALLQLHDNAPHVTSPMHGNAGRHHAILFFQAYAWLLDYFERVTDKVAFNKWVLPTRCTHAELYAKFRAELQQQQQATAGGVEERIAAFKTFSAVWTHHFAFVHQPKNTSLSKCHDCLLLARGVETASTHAQHEEVRVAFVCLLDGIECMLIPDLMDAVVGTTSGTHRIPLL